MNSLALKSLVLDTLVFPTETSSLTLPASHEIPGPVYHDYFGYHIDAFHDILSAPERERSSMENSIEQVLADWTRSIHSLSGYYNRRLSLRYHWNPAQGKINAALIGATHNVIPGANDMFDVIAGNFLESSHVVSRKFQDVAGEMAPFLCMDGRRFVHEIRQRENVFPIENPLDAGASFSAYGVFSYKKPDGTLYDLCKALTGCKGDVIASFHLQPAQLRQAEMSAFEAAINILGKFADFEYKAKYTGNDIRFRDQNAQYLLDVYKNLRERFQECFLFTAQVVSESRDEGKYIAGRVTAQMQGGGAAPEIRTPSAQVEQEAALRTFNRLWLTDWGSFVATPGKERMRFLGDSSAASAVFRLPIPTKHGLPGLSVIKPEESFQTVVKTDDAAKKDSLLIGAYAENKNDSVYYSIHNLTRHALVCGGSGSGKSNTTLNLLFQLWRDHKIPFWVVEPPKSEYRGLKLQEGFEDALVFSLGDETIAPFRFNPFEVPPGVILEKHLARLETAFRAAIPAASGDGEIFLTLINSSLRSLYQRLGWDDMDTCESGHATPLMQDLLEEVSKTVASYGSETRQNMDAAIKNRLRPLTQGSKGHMFNTMKGFPVAELFDRPVVFELEAMGDFAPVMMAFMLMLLRGQADSRRGAHLQHVTVIEEAHLLMERSEGGDSERTRHATRMFENLLAEIRSKGEGVVIVDQTPSKLIQGAIDNTALKIIHRLANKDEVERLSGSILATEQQGESIIRQSPGSACVFFPGLQGPLFTRVPAFKNDSKFNSDVPGAEIKDRMASYYRRHDFARLPFPACVFCEEQCKHRSDCKTLVEDEQCLDDLNEEFAALKKKRETDKTVASFPLDTLLKYTSSPGTSAATREKAWCLFVHWMLKRGDTIIRASRAGFIRAMRQKTTNS